MCSWTKFCFLFNTYIHFPISCMENASHITWWCFSEVIALHRVSLRYLSPVQGLLILVNVRYYNTHASTADNIKSQKKSWNFHDSLPHCSCSYANDHRPNNEPGIFGISAQQLTAPSWGDMKWWKISRFIYSPWKWKKLNIWT